MRQRKEREEKRERNLKKERKRKAKIKRKVEKVYTQLGPSNQAIS